MVDYKFQEKKSFLHNLKKWKNLVYILLALAILIMICIAAANQKNPYLYRQYKETVSPIKNQTSGILFGCPSLKKGSLLTFDDGPSTNTPDILDYLRNANITAVFFLAPHRLEQFPDHVTKILADGHQVGVYLEGKDNFPDDDDKFDDVIRDVENIFENATGVKPQLLRTATGPLDKVVQHAVPMGITVVVWNAATHRVDATDENDQKLVGQSLALVPNYGAILSFSERTKITGKLLKQAVQEVQSDTPQESFLPTPYLTPNECFNPKKLV